MLAPITPPPITATAAFVDIREYSRLPLSLRHLGHEAVETARGKGKSAPGLRAHVRGHQYLHDFESIVEREHRALSARECTNEMAILSSVTVCGSFVGYDRHHSDLGVLFLDKIFACFAFY